MNDKVFIEVSECTSKDSMTNAFKHPVKGKTVHQDTDETKVIGILSAVILVLTILTVGSYADDYGENIQQQLISKKSMATELNRPSQTTVLVNSNDPTDRAADDTLLEI